MSFALRTPTGVVPIPETLLLQQRYFESDRGVHRAPFAERFVISGDGLPKPNPLVFTGRVYHNTPESAIEWLNAFNQSLAQATELLSVQQVSFERNWSFERGDPVSNITSSNTPGFEQIGSGSPWAIVNNPANAKTGNQYAAVVTNQDGAARILRYFGYCPCVPGDELAVTVHSRLTNGTASGRVRVYLFNQDKAAIQNFAVGAAVTLTNNYQPIHRVVTITNPNARFFKPAWTIESSAPATGIHLDDVESQARTRECEIHGGFMVVTPTWLPRVFQVTIKIFPRVAQ